MKRTHELQYVLKGGAWVSVPPTARSGAPLEGFSELVSFRAG
jgi:hypothetical protein